MELVYAELHKIIKSYAKKKMSDVNVAELILDAIILSADLKNKLGDVMVIEKHTASKLVNRTINIPTEIKNAAALPSIKSDVCKYFEDSVLPALNIGFESKIILDLTQIINNDAGIPIDMGKALKVNAQANSLHLFLADILLYVAKVANKKEKKKDTLTYKNKPLPEAEVPKEVQEKELPYVTAILNAYADKEKVAKVAKNELEKYNYTENFNRQRKSYFNAEFLNRKSRDAYADEDPAPFEVLKKEIKEGVIDVWDSEHANGFERMSKVLAQASQTTAESCLLSRDTLWLSNDAKKGVCHILVNEDIIKGWVK